MKRIWTRAAAAAALCAVLLGGCAFAGGIASDRAPADPLTGQELQYPGQRTAAAVIDNTGTVQWGIGSASVVLEAQTEVDTPTSLSLVYPAVDAMPRVGPVTLGQDLYWRLLSGQQVIPVQRGGGQFDRSYLDYYNIRAVDALEVGRNAFSCDSSWSNAPLWCTSGADVQGVLNSLNISSSLDELAAASSGAASEDADSGTVTAALPPLLPQRAEPHLPEPQSEEAARVQVHFGTRSATGFAYDETSGTYGMLRADGTPQTDANTGTQAQFDNLLILFSGSSLRDDQRTLDYDLTLGGGFWLHGGNLWSITWTQGTDSTLAFYDADGRPLTLCNGRSYLALVSSVTGEEVGIQNTAGEELLAH